MELIAHRGFAAEAPENTVDALVRAAARADALEFDVRRCATGEPVVVHDRTVDRVTESSGPVRAFTPEELANMSVQGSQGEGDGTGETGESADGIPTLSAVLGAVPSSTPLLVELKERAVVPAVCEALADRPGSAVLASFDRETLLAVRRVDPHARIAPIAGTRHDRPFATALELDATAVLLRARLLAFPSVRRATRQLDHDVYAWTIRRRPTAALVGTCGIDGVIADRSNVLG